MNNVNIVGNLVKDISLIVLEKNNLPIANFVLAIPKKLSKEKKEEYEKEGKTTAYFVNCIAYGSQAQLLQKNASKGDSIALEGRLQSRLIKREYTTINILEIVVNSFNNFKKYKK